MLVRTVLVLLLVPAEAARVDSTERIRSRSSDAPDGRRACSACRSAPCWCRNCNRGMDDGDRSSGREKSEERSSRREEEEKMLICLWIMPRVRSTTLLMDDWMEEESVRIGWGCE